MTLTESILSERAILALLVFSCLAMLEPVLEARLSRLLRDSAPFDWTWDYLVSPLLRAVLITGFVVFAYPAVFGFVEAPSIGSLLADGHARFSNLLFIVFASTLLLPMVPVLGPHREIVLPIQGIMITAVVFHWFVSYLGATAASVWPGTYLAALILVLSVLLHFLATTAARLLGELFDRQYAVSGSHGILQNGLEMLMQAPLIFVYGHALGRQFGG